MASNQYLYGDDPDDMDDYQVPNGNSSEVVFTPPQRSSLVDVEVGDDRLPTNIKLSRRWKDAFEPSQYGKSIMDAYHYAVYELAVRLVENGIRPRSSWPSLREVVPLLLQQRTYDEFHAVWNSLYLDTAYTVHGPGYNQYDEPGLTVTATRSTLLSIAIDTSWATTVHGTAIAQDILECCDQVRAKKAKLVRDIYLDQETDQELTDRLVRHEQQLMRNEI
ncbi:hypothetical protein OHB12_18145 [Nocardia sp. NBC_01730]|uniref:hypothetical protein n=1 Tax=Nocardia sp. NBC_01730 TaxID=2975998 RepID=UPI002E12CEBA|nr:hypothetical protein OHB12_18145 [Nocardia sp. NBC_01730]